MFDLTHLIQGAIRQIITNLGVIVELSNLKRQNIPTVSFYSIKTFSRARGRAEELNKASDYITGGG